MATQTHAQILKLADDDPKSLGVSHLTTAPVTCPGLTEGVDFAVERMSGTVRRLRPFGYELLTFTCQYDDGSEARAAEEAAIAADRETVRTAIANLRTYSESNNPNTAQTVAAVKLLCRVAIILIKRALAVQE